MASVEVRVAVSWGWSRDIGSTIREANPDRASGPSSEAWERDFYVDGAPREAGTPPREIRPVLATEDHPSNPEVFEVTAFGPRLPGFAQIRGRSPRSIGATPPLR